MEFKNKNILIVSPEPWNHIFVSKHHYATHLAKMGAHVVFANPPKKKWQLDVSGFDNVQILDYPKFVKGLRRMPTVLAKKLIRYRLEEIEAFTQLKYDIIWSFDNSVFFDFSELQKSFNISHIVDLNQDFETERAASSADMCLYTTNFIGDRLKKWNSNSHFIHHGYNQTTIDDQIILPGENKMKIVYAGNLDMPFIDWDILLKCTSNFAHVDFIFIGPLTTGIRHYSKTKTLDQENVYPIGKVDSSILPAYYDSADALLICYDEKYHRDQANPHKMMEYLGSGKPIIATWTDCFSQLDDDLIIMNRSNRALPGAISQFIDNKANYQSDTLTQKRRNFAIDHTYDNQLNKIEALCNSI